MKKFLSKEYFARRKYLFASLFLCELTLTLTIYNFFLRADDSLWIDEITSFWVISGGWSEIYPRTYLSQGHTAFYYQILYLLVSSLGQSEAILRLPSFFFGVASLAILGLIEQRIFLRKVYGFLPLFTACQFHFFESLVSARPYGFIFFLNTLLIFYSVRLIQKPKFHSFLVCVLLISCCAINHFAYGLLFLIWPVAMFVTEARSFILKPSSLTILFLFGSSVAAVFFQQLVRLALLSAHVGIKDIPSFEAAMLVQDFQIIHAIILFLLSIGIILQYLFKNKKRNIPRLGEFGRFSAVLFLLGPVCLFFASHLVKSNVVIPRYFLYYEIGFCLLVTIIFHQIRGFLEVPIKGFVISVVVLLSPVCGRVVYLYEDWRAAIYQSETYGNNNSLFGVRSAMQNADWTDYYSDPKAIDFLTCPLGYYSEKKQGISLPTNGILLFNPSYLNYFALNSAFKNRLVFILRDEYQASRQLEYLHLLELFARQWNFVPARLVKYHLTTLIVFEKFDPGNPVVLKAISMNPPKS